MNQLEKIGSLKLKELEIFYLAAKTQSIREVARRLRVTPGQVSKSIRAIEKKTESVLFMRSSSGVVLSEVGHQLVSLSEAILEDAYRIESLQKKDRQKTLGISSTSFLITYLLAPAVTKGFANQPHQLFRFHDFAPDQMVSAGLRGAFQIAFHFGKLEWPHSWLSEKVGSVPWVLCARQKHPLKKESSRSEVLEFPFAIPTYWTSEGLKRGSDFFEVPLSKRKLGYETSTADAAIPILLNSNHVAYLPSLLVQPYLDRNELKVIEVNGLKPTEKDLYVSIKEESVTSKVFENLKSSVSSLLNW